MFRVGRNLIERAHISTGHRLFRLVVLALFLTLGYMSIFSWVVFVKTY